MRVYNSLSRRVEELEPGPSGRLGVYVCGVTVYARCHLGHAMSAVVFDVIVRYLKDRFGAEQVKYVVNFTDIDDKILDAAQKENTSWRELSSRYIQSYYDDLARLNVARADVYPKASEHVPGMVKLIGDLEKKGLAYRVEGDGVYFEISKLPGYGRLSGRSPDDMLAGHRVERDDRFRHPGDFCLWKLWDHPDAWESPWGRGRPGWHIECSAMVEEVLGLPLDIHGGGMDLKFPHHENEIAQSEGAGADPFARYWLHNGLLERDGQKVAKSTGNLVSIEETVRRYGAGGVRHYLLSHLYRSPLKFDEALLGDNMRAYDRLAECRKRLVEVASRPLAQVGMRAQVTELLQQIYGARETFTKAMDEDFNTPQGLAAIHDLVRALNRTLGLLGEDRPHAELRDALGAGRHVLDGLMKLLGFVATDGAWLEGPTAAAAGGESDGLITLLLELRTEARGRKDFGTADKIRKSLDALGIEIQDGSQGSSWRRK